MQENLSFVHKFTRVLTECLFFIGIAVTITIPLWAFPFMDFIGYQPAFHLPESIVLALSGIFALGILWQLRAMLKTVAKGNAFVRKNVNCLRRAAVFCALIAFTYAGRIVFLYFTFGSMAVCVIFALLSIFALTLKDVFKQAVEYKEDVDGTV